MFYLNVNRDLNPNRACSCIKCIKCDQQFNAFAKASIRVIVLFELSNMTMSNESDLRSVALSQSMRIVKSNEYKYTALLSANCTVKGKNRM